MTSWKQSCFRWETEQRLSLIHILYVGDRVKIRPIVFGGGQERGLRSGTENVPAIAGTVSYTHLEECEETAEASAENTETPEDGEASEEKDKKGFFSGRKKEKKEDAVKAQINELQDKVMPVSYTHLG